MEINWSEAVIGRCSVKKVFLRNFGKFIGKHLRQSFYFNKVAGLSPATLLKKKLLWFCEISKNTFFYRTPLLAASNWSLRCLSEAAIA